MSSTRVETAKRFFAGFTDLSTEGLVGLRTDDCPHEFAPASLKFPICYGKEGFANHIKPIQQVMAGFPVTPYEILESEKDNSVMVWAIADARFREEYKDVGLPAEEWEYRGEYVFILWMDESGKRIRRIVEFLDSKATERVMKLVGRATENKQKASS